MTRDEAIHALIEQDVARWGASCAMRPSRSTARSVRLALRLVANEGRSMNETWTWAWSWQYPGDTCPAPERGRVFASRAEAEDEIRACAEFWDRNVIRHESPGGKPCHRKVYRVVG